MDTWKHFCFTYEVVNKSGPSEAEVKMIVYYEGEKTNEGILYFVKPENLVKREISQLTFNSICSQNLQIFYFRNLDI